LVRPWSTTAASHASFAVEEALETALHVFGECAVHGGEHAAEAHSILAQDVVVQLDVGVQLADGGIGFAVDGAERIRERLARARC